MRLRNVLVKNEIKLRAFVYIPILITYIIHKKHHQNKWEREKNERANGTNGWKQIDSKKKEHKQ